MKKFWGLVLGAAAGLTATTTALVLLGNRRVNKWETLTQADASDGDFVTLADGTRIHFVARGPATTLRAAPTDVILIHGLMDSAEQWRANLDALARTQRVWAIDLPGFGFSSRITTPTYSMKMFARALAEFMEAQGIARASIVGHSLGGAVALEFAHDFPARVDKLVLLAPATFLLQFRPALRVARRLPWVPRALIGWTLTSRRARERALRDALGDPARFDAAELARRIRPMRVRGTADALVAMLGSPHGSALPRDLTRITAPTLILWGAQDRAVPPRHGEYHARALPHARLVVLEGAGHIPQFECPDKVNPLILEFLNARENNE